MKNCKFVVGLLLSSVLINGTQAASVTPQNEADRPAFPPSGASAIVFQKNAHAPQVQMPAPRSVAAGRENPVAQLPINHFLSFVNLPKAFHYLDGDSDPVRGARVQTKLAQQGAVAESVTEPASEVLLLAGLSALAIAIRRQSPS